MTVKGRDKLLSFLDRIIQDLKVSNVLYVQQSNRHEKVNALYKCTYEMKLGADVTYYIEFCAVAQQGIWLLHVGKLGMKYVDNLGTHTQIVTGRTDIDKLRACRQSVAYRLTRTPARCTSTDEPKVNRGRILYEDRELRVAQMTGEKYIKSFFEQEEGLEDIVRAYVLWTLTEVHTDRFGRIDDTGTSKLPVIIRAVQT